MPVALAIGLGLVVVRVALGLLAADMAARLVSGRANTLRLRLTRAYLWAQWGQQHGDRVGRLQELASGHTQRFVEFLSACVAWVGAAFNLAALQLAALAVDLRTSVGVMVGVFLLGSLLRPIRSAVRRRSKEVAQANMEVSTSLSEAAASVLELQVFRVQGAVVGDLERSIGVLMARTRRVMFLRGVTPSVYNGLAYLALLAGLLLASTFERTALASVGAVMLVMLRSLSYGQALQTSSATAHVSLPYLDELEQELARLETHPCRRGGEPIGVLGAVAFHDVEFSYDGVTHTLKPMTFELRPGEIVGVVGPSGSGKSTMVQLLLGLREPTAGRITAAGRDLESLDADEWARKVTFVPQSPRLVAGTIADNIRFFRDDISDDDIVRASKAANLHGDVVSWAEGYGREVGEIGSRLSGGQMQRLTIARALVENPELLVLDEPTSSLDARSEQLVKETLAQLRQRMTIVIIAHRLSTLDICDRIMVIQAGELRALGSPNELAASSAFYRDALRIAGLSG